MEETNHYSAPDATLYEPRETGDYGSVEKALAGDYELRIGEVLSAAWSATAGNKMRVNGAALVAFLVAIGFMTLSGIVAYLFGGGTLGNFASLPVDIVYYGVASIMTVGFYVMGAKISMELPTGINELFRFMGKLLKGLVTYIITMVLVLVGLILLVLPGIYLMVAAMFAIALAVEKDMSPWQAVVTSCKAVTHRWFAMFGILIVFALLFALGALTLGIAYIWLVPMAVITYGIIYRDMFGLEAETLSS